VSGLEIHFLSVVVTHSLENFAGVTEEEAQTDLQDMVQDRFAMFEGVLSSCHISCMKGR
jgi:hypothetical protein